MNNQNVRVVMRCLVTDKECVADSGCQCENCKNAPLYPCDDCGVMRSQNEGGTTFTVCDECWDKHYYSENDPNAYYA